MNIYDKLLAGIGATLLLMLAGYLVIPPAGFIASGIGLALVCSAMFMYAPVDSPTTTT